MKLVAGTTTGFVDGNTEYTDKPGSNTRSPDVRISNTGHGFTVCTDVPERRKQAIYTVPSDYTPLQSQIPFTA